MEMSLGVDIEEVSRFKTLIRNKRFLRRVYTPEEIAYCSSKKNKSQHFAVRFAAKEAVWKALSEPLEALNRRIAHHEIGIVNAESGKPHVILPKVLSRFRKKVLISLSHSQSHVVAVAFVKA